MCDCQSVYVRKSAATDTWGGNKKRGKQDGSKPANSPKYSNGGLNNRIFALSHLPIAGNPTRLLYGLGVQSKSYEIALVDFYKRDTASL